jgi:hypothetical protein
LPSGRVGNAGRNILRADSIRSVDFGIIKNTRISENVRVQLRADMFNVFNERNFGIPNAVVTQTGVAPVVTNAASFLDQWGTDGGTRRIVLGARIVF